MDYEGYALFFYVDMLMKLWIKNFKIMLTPNIKPYIIIHIGGELMKEVVITATTKVQESGTNFFTTIPATVRSVLKPEKGDEIEFVVYSDKSIELRMKQKGSE